MSDELSVRRLQASGFQPGKNLFPRWIQEVSLYVHIPFCTSRCRYCNFYFETGWSPRVLEACLKGILDESSQWARLYSASAGTCSEPKSLRLPSVHTLYFGGGTPSIVPPPILDTFLQDFRRIWHIGPEFGRSPVEWAFEANPESVSPELLQVLGKHGIDRLSLGVQSFDTEVLLALGRRADQAAVEQALTYIEQARTQASWRGKLNLDLITGIPGRDLNSARRDIDLLLAARPDHVSVYTLTVEEHTPLAQSIESGAIPEPDPEDQERQWLVIDQELEAAGLRNYEVSNYARVGDESQHNLAYWQLKPYIGLGPGAVSTIPVELAITGPSAPTKDGPGGQGGQGSATGPDRSAIARITNPHIFSYQRSYGGPSVELLNARDFFTDRLLTGLRIETGIALEELITVFSPCFGSEKLQECLQAIADHCEQKGLLASQQGVPVLQPDPSTPEPPPGKPAPAPQPGLPSPQPALPTPQLQRLARIPTDSRRLALNKAGRMLLNPLMLELMDFIEQLEVIAAPESGVRDPALPDWPYGLNTGTLTNSTAPRDTKQPTEPGTPIP